MIVVKVGGSLFDLPELSERLRAFLATLSDPDVLLVPGGGRVADVVRFYDGTHALDATAAHWLALRACSLNAHLLGVLLSEAALVAHPQAGAGLTILDPHAFAVADDALPRSWDATSDSVAARAAAIGDAELVLVKSIAIPVEMSWREASERGYVDPLFADLVVRHALKVRAVNLRV